MAAKKPNVLIIWGDDIGISNLSCYSDGLMGYKTPEVSFFVRFRERKQERENEEKESLGKKLTLLPPTPPHTKMYKKDRPPRQGGHQVHRLLRRAVLHRRARRLPDRHEPLPLGPDESRHARSQDRPQRRRLHSGDRDAGCGPPHGPVREEPPGRPGRVPADQPRVPGVFR